VQYTGVSLDEMWEDRERSLRWHDLDRCV
jgi:hypothetical protein